MIDMSELTESVKGYIEGLQDVLQRKYQISEDEAREFIDYNATFYIEGGPIILYRLEE